ncbi:MAG: hypothetical protein H0U71_04965 [Gammaproteobacteria bacterium]|nr:hypothetical protein [Gammaproteobacteria bacterium]
MEWVEDKDIFTNQDFCYWLQGYFEISELSNLDVSKIDIIRKKLTDINEPLGEYTSWLIEVIEDIEMHDFQNEIIMQWEDPIRLNLASIFKHVIDDSYSSAHSKEKLQKTHDETST